MLGKKNPTFLDTLNEIYLDKKLILTITCPISASGTSSTHFLEPPLPFLSEVLIDRRADFFLLLVAKLGKINEFREQIN